MKPSQPSKLPPPTRIPGLPVPLLERLRRLPRWIWFIVGVGMLPLLAIPAVALARYTTSSPPYCTQCHGTGETPVTALRSMVHPRTDQVACVQCHAKPGQIVFEGYVKGFMAEPERVNQNCVRCHQNITTTNDQEGFLFNFFEIRVPHKFHLQLGATCVTCHSNVAHDFQVPPTNRPRKEVCSQCHAATAACSKCHIGELPTEVMPIPASPPPGVAADGRTLYLRTCSGCHGPRGNQIKEHNLSSPDFLNRLGKELIAREIERGHGSMPGFGKGRGGELTPDQVQALVAHIWTLPRLEGAGIDGASLYNSNCLVCHGKDGNRVAEARLGSREFLEKAGDAALLDALIRGKGGMPAFGKTGGGTLGEEEVKALLAYMKSLAAQPQR